MKQLIELLFTYEHLYFIPTMFFIVYIIVIHRFSEHAHTFLYVFVSTINKNAVNTHTRFFSIDLNCASLE